METIPPPITAEELAARLMDEAQAEDTLATYFELTGGPLAFDYALRDEAEVEGVERLPDLLAAYDDEEVTEARALVTRSRSATPAVRGKLGLMGMANGVKRRKRNRRFRQALETHPDRLTLVSEGDSWFVYPWKLVDVIEHLTARYNVYSAGAAGDELSEMYRQQEYGAALTKYDASILLLSGGGNDVLGPDSLPHCLRETPRDGVDGAERWVQEDYFHKRVGQVLNLYELIFYDLKKNHPTVTTIVHGYDYAQPSVQPIRGVPPFTKGKANWLSGPMQAKGMSDVALQRDVVRVLIDIYNERMSAFVQEQQQGGVQVHFLDVRETILPNQWANEIHPDDKGYQQVALKFETLICRIS